MYQRKPNTVGRMRYRVAVQTPTKSDSQGQQVVDWSNWLTNEPADYEYVRGRQSTRGRQVEEGVDCIFTVRYRSAHSPDNRVVFNSENYGIVFVRPVEGRNEYMELHAKVIKS